MLNNYMTILVLFFGPLLNTTAVFAQGHDEMMTGMQSGSNAMCGTMGWGGMVLGGLLTVAAICALISLSIFLIRRSRHAGH